MNLTDDIPIIHAIYNMILEWEDTKTDFQDKKVKDALYRSIALAFHIGRAFEKTDPVKSLIDRYKDTLAILTIAKEGGSSLN